MRALNRRRSCRNSLVAAVVLGLFVWFFGRALLTPTSFAFRDAGHYYYPLFRWCCEQWAAGDVPLWNPDENLGVPVLADTTSSVFYPGKLLFVLPLEYATRYKLYVAGHVLLAAAGAFVLARRMRTSNAAAGLAAIAYAFGGSVLFQVANVVFLVGAAWLPFAFWFVDRGLRGRRWRDAIGLGAVLALMTLGGDPHAAYHTGLLAAGYAALLWRADQRRGRRVQKVARETAASSDRFGMRHRLAWLAIAAATGLLLAAVQILPAWQWSSRSNRATFDRPRSVYEVPQAWRRVSDRQPVGWHVVRDGLLGEPQQGTHHEHIYHFSVGPWRLAEMLWPNVSGKMFPVNHRWTNAIPAEGRIWTPTLYMGLLPIVFGLAALRWRRGDARQRWLSWTWLLATLASFGWYGAGWLIHEVRYSVFGAAADDLWLGQPVGGVYWWLATFLPGYANFRFPAKWSVVAALALSLLAARGWDRWQRHGGTAPVVLAASLLMISLLIWALTFPMEPRWHSWLKGAPPDVVFGPLDSSGALADLRAALLHAGALAAIALAAFVICSQRRTDWRGRSWWGGAFVVLTAIDLAVANAWLLPTAPLDRWYATPPAVRAIEAASRRDGSSSETAPRIYRHDIGGWYPRSWLRTSAANQIDESVDWDRRSLFPKHHLLHDMALVESYGTMSAADFSEFLRTAKRHRDAGAAWSPHARAEAMRMIGTQFIVAPSAPWPGVTPIALPAASAADNVKLWRDREAMPRVWIVRDIERIKPLASEHPADVRRRTELILFPAGRPRDFRRQAVVEMPRELGDVLLPSTNHVANESRERCDVESYRPQRIVLEVELDAPALVVLADYCYPGWQAERIDRDGTVHSLPIVRTNRILRGVFLPSGKHRVVMTYRPLPFRWGAAVSAIAWSLLAAAPAVRRAGKRRRKSGR